MSRYRIFCLKDEVENLPSEVTIEEQYPAFVIVSAPAEVIEKIRKRYSVEELKDPKEPPKPPAFANLPIALTQPQKRGPYFCVLRFLLPIKSDWLEEIKATGSEICGPLGRFTVWVKCPNKPSKAKLQWLSFEVKITRYIPHIHVTPSFLKYPSALITTFFTDTDQRRVRRKLRQYGIRKIIKVDETHLAVDLTDWPDPAEAIRQIATQKGLYSLEQDTPLVTCNAKARTIIGADVLSTPIPQDLNLTGRGEIIGVGDTGLDTGHPDLKDKVKQIYHVPLPREWSRRIENLTLDDGPADTNNGHGTHVCGSIVGGGACGGIAQNAEIIFHALEHKATGWTQKGLSYWRHGPETPPPDPPYFLGVPFKLQSLFKLAYTQNAYIYCCAWGGEGRSLSYGWLSGFLDDFVWNHKDFLVINAVGNDGRPISHDDVDEEVVRLGRIVQPATAKNCLTVGATENDYADHPELSKHTYGINAPVKVWLNAPFNTDKIVNPDDIFALSSRGPTSDGRRKPDVVAPGAPILSARSSKRRQDCCKGWPEYESGPYAFTGGSSMATALVTGCVALVRQYLREIEQKPNPTAALMKAVIIHSAQYIPYRFAHPESRPPNDSIKWWADNEQGWGRVNLKQALKPDPPTKILFRDEVDGLLLNTARRFKIKISDDSVPLRITMTYTDFKGHGLINNLNLSVRGPNHNNTLGNDFRNEGEPDSHNNTETILINTPDVGEWLITVTFSNSSSNVELTQDFALVISGGGLEFIKTEEINELSTLTPHPL